MLEDKRIIKMFSRHSELAIKELDDKYGIACRKISFHILNNYSDMEECVNDAYLAVWSAIPPARPKPLSTYLFKIVRNISLKRYYMKTAEKRNSIFDVSFDELGEYLSAPNTVESEIEAKELAHIIENFLDTLTIDDRVIFMRRYWFCDTYFDIAQRVGLTEKNVSVRLTRIRKRMKQYLVEREILNEHKNTV